MVPDIDKLRAAAKRLKKAFASSDPGAIGRLSAIVPGSAAPKHADFLHVIAREHGYENWPKLKFGVEAAAMSHAQRAERLGRARQLLEETALGMERVAEAAGFGSTQTLRHHFRQQLSTTPAAYRAAFGRMPVSANSPAEAATE